MPSFKIEDLMKSVYGSALNARQMPSENEGEVVRVAGRRGKRPLHQTETLILNFIAASKDAVTMLEICDHLDRKPAPHFRRIVDKLVSEGKVARKQDNEASPNLPRYLYSINRG